MDIPHLRCAKHSLGAVSADPQAGPWPEIAPTMLRVNVGGGVPKQATWFKTAWNDEEFRVLFWIEDDDIWYTMTERDSHIWEEEAVEIFFDPVGDLQTYYEFELNPANTVLDLVLWREGEGYKSDFKWQCKGLRTAARRTDVGWCGEFSIPFASIGGKRSNRCRVNFYRIDRPKRVGEELSAWSPTDTPTFHTQDRFGVLEFVE